MRTNQVKRPREIGRKRDPTIERGYGAEHKKRRAQEAKRVAGGDAVCARCGRWIRPGEPWDLGHHDQNRTIHVGPEHRRCNRGATRAKALRRSRSRVW